MKYDNEHFEYDDLSVRSARTVRVARVAAAGKIFVILLLALFAACAVFGVAACSKKKEDESGASSAIYGLGEEDWYYYESASSTYYLELNSGLYTLYMDSKLNSSGTYTFNAAGTQITFIPESGSSFTAPYIEGFLSLTLGREGYVFQRYTYFTVTYIGRTGSVVETETVLNGKAAEGVDAPDLSMSGYEFVAWYKDSSFSSSTKYAFNVSVTGDLTLYARYVSVDSSAPVYKVTYDYTTGPVGDVTCAETINGLIYSLPEVDGLLGWWMSDTNVGSELSRRFIEEESVLTSDTTLFAVWDGALGVSVTEDGVFWENYGGSTTAVTVKDESGETVLRSDGVLSSSMSYTPDGFESLPTGKYTVTVTSGSMTETRVFVVNPLARVSGFSAEDGILTFVGVENATAYYIDVECASANHNHDHVLLSGTVFDFSDCDMPAEGITFTVYAVADGYYSSSATFNYFLGLDAPIVSVSDDVVSWTGVDGASGYELYINDDLVYSVSASSGSVSGSSSAFSYSLEGYDMGDELSIVVKPIAKGYYSAGNEPVGYTKVRLATPTGVSYSGGIISWTAVAGASGYEIHIGDTVVVVDLGTISNYIIKDDDIGDADSYVIYVIAVAEDPAHNSLASVSVTVSNVVTGDSFYYNDGSVYWDYFAGATSYIVSVNGEMETETEDYHFAVTLTQSGENVVTLDYVYDGEIVMRSEITVFAYAIVLDPREGYFPAGAAYFCEGDTIVLPEPEAPTGYEFGGWYTLPDNVAKTPDSPVYYEGEGTLFENGVYVCTGDASSASGYEAIYYAFYAPALYSVTFALDAAGYIIDGNGDIVYDSTGAYATEYTMELYYERRYTAPDAVSEDAARQFVGWYEEKNRGGNALTGDVWTIASDTVIYSGYLVVLTFTLTTYNGQEMYAVSKGTNISQVTEVTVPAYYNGIKVGVLQSNAFTSCTNLYVLNLPDTIEYISTTNNGYSSGSGAFASCSKLAAVNIIEGEGAYERFYYSVDGVLFRKTSDTGRTAELVYYPHGKTDSVYVIPEVVYNLGELDAIDGGLYYSVTNLCTQVFRSNSYLVEVVVPATVVSVESQVFYSCTNLVKVTFEAVVSSGGTQATALTFSSEIFRNCTSLTEVTLPTYLESFDYTIFSGDEALCDVFVSGTGGNYSQSEKDTGILLSEGGRTLVYYPAGKSGEFTITDNSIVKIADYAFYGNTRITSVAMPAWVTEIGEYAFYGCTAVTSLVFSGDATSPSLSVGSYAFFNCERITSLYLPENVVAIGAYAFGGCKALVTVEVTSSNVSGYEDGAFSTSSGTFYVTTLILGESVPEMDIVAVFGYEIKNLQINEGNENYFINSDNIVYSADKARILYCPSGMYGPVTLLDTVTEVYGNVFRSRNITSVYIPKSVAVIDDYAFYGCTSLTNVTFEERDSSCASLTIGDRAFSGCNALTGVYLPYGTIYIGDYAFYSCRKVVTFVILDGLEHIGSHAFDSCVKIRSFTLGEGNNLTIGNYVFNGDKAMAEFVVPSGVVAIGDYAFQSCTGLKTITLGENVESVGAYAFSGCTSLTTVEMDSALREIGNYAFRNCTSLKEVEIADGVETLGDYAFSGCTALVSVHIPASLSVMGEEYGPYYVFNGCTSLYEIDIASDSTHFELVDGTLYGLGETISDGGGTEYIRTDVYMTFSFYDSEVTIPNTVTRVWANAFASTNITKIIFDGVFDAIDVGSGAFSGCTSLVEVVLPEGLLTISADMFKNCSALETINVPSTVSSIQSAFSGCSSLTELVFDGTPEGQTPVELELSAGTSSRQGAFYGTALTDFVFPERLVAIPDYLFYNVTTLCSVDIPSTVQSIGYRAFYGCGSLTSVTFSNPDASLLTEIGYSAFYGCAFESISFPSGITEFPDGSSATTGMFSGNANLKYVSLPDTLEILGRYSFYGCTSLYASVEGGTSFVIPDSVVEIDMRAFYNCSSIVSYDISDESDLALVGGYAFYGCTKLSSFSFPASIEFIGMTTSGDNGTASTTKMEVFQGCTSLEKVTFRTYESGENKGKSSLRVLASATFDGCTALTAFSFPETLSGLDSIANDGTALGYEIFTGCGSLTYVYLSSTVVDISRVFVGCTSVKTMEVSSANVNFVVDEQNCILTNPAGTVVRFAYNLSSSGATIDLSGTGITEIGRLAFYGNTSISTVRLPSSLTKVDYGAFASSSVKTVVFADGTASLTIEDGDKVSTTYYGAFSSCTSLTSVTLPSNLESIGVYAFYGCTALTSINIPSAKTIGDDAFRGCTSLTSITLPGNLETLGDEAFYGCTGSISSIVIPESLTYLPDRAFYGCSGLVEVVLPSTLTTFVDTVTSSTSTTHGSQFSGCTKLKKINLENIATLSYRAFYGCSSLDDITLSSDLSGVPEESFYGCTALTNIVMSDGVQKIGERAFSGCTSLTSVSVPYTVVEIDVGAFSGCTKLSTVLFEALPSSASGYELEIADGTDKSSSVFYNTAIVTFVVPSRLSRVSDYLFYGCTSLVVVTYEGDPAYDSTESYDDGYFALSDGTQIGSYSFYGCTALVGVDLTGTETAGADHAFSGCTSIVDLTLDPNMEAIADYMFYGCLSIGALSLPDGLVTIGERAFYGCSSASLTTLVIPASVEYIGEGAFYCWTYLSEIVVEENASGSDSSDDVELVFADGGSSSGMFMGSQVEDVYFPARVTSLGSYMFCDVATLKTVDFADGIKINSIPECTFSGCENLYGIIIPEGVETIGADAFRDCLSIDEIVIPYTVLLIEPGAFISSEEHASSLTTVTFEDVPQGESLDDYPLLFLGGNDKSYAVFGNASYLTDIILPERCVGIGGEMFRNCESITEMYIPSRVDNLGYDYYVGSPNNNRGATFYGCTSLVSVSFGADCRVSALYSNVFSGCTSLVDINLIDTNITVINYNAFYNCPNVSVILLPSTLEDIEQQPFDGTSITEITIPASVTYIEGLTTSKKNAFYGCDLLENITVEDGNTRYKSIDGILYTIDGEVLCCPAAKTGDVILSEGTSVGVYGFYNCRYVTSVSLPDSLINIPRYAFEYCTSLTSMTIPDGVDTIENEAFLGCTALETLTIGSSVTTMNQRAFGDCTALTEIYYNAVECDDMGTSTAVFRQGGRNGTGIAVYIGANVMKIPDYLFCGGTSGTDNAPYIKEVVFADGVCESIGVGAFYNCLFLESVELSSDIASIGESAFRGCTALTSFVIPDNAEEIGSYAFYGCSDLTDVTYGEGIRIIGASAFYNCTSLTSVVIPVGTEEIGTNAFRGCTAVSEIYFNAESMADLTNSSGVFYNAGSGVSGGIAVTIGKDATYIPAYLFQGYTSVSYKANITSVVFENGSVCEEIRDCAFRYCQALESIVIPASVVRIGDSAFESCQSLTRVYYGGTSSSDWSEIDVSSTGNSYLTSAALYCYSTESESGNFWHYGDDGKSVVAW